MNVVGMVLKCSTGTILSTYTASVNDWYKKTQSAEKVAIYWYFKKIRRLVFGVVQIVKQHCHPS
jgi:hypothetical protein